MSKTVVIWDSLDADLRFFVVNKDVSHLDREYVNSSNLKPKYEKELLSMVYVGGNSGEYLPIMLKSFPIQEVVDGAKVITCGFLP